MAKKGVIEKMEQSEIVNYQILWTNYDLII